MKLAELESRERAIAEARTWLKTPHHHRAHIKGAGVDCGWLLIEVYSAVGVIPRFDPGEYPLDWMLHREEERYLEWVERYAARVGVPAPADLVMYKRGRCYSHGAIVLDWPEQVLHAHVDEGVVISHGLGGHFAEYPHRFYSPWAKH